MVETKTQAIPGVAEIDFNPTVSTGVHTYSLEHINEPLGITCLTAAQCIAIDSTGGGASDVLTFDPSNGVATPHPVQPAGAIACPPSATRATLLSCRVWWHGRRSRWPRR